MIHPSTVLTGIGIVLVAISLPLVFRKVPMNHAYGVRIQKAFESDSNWYAINAFGGKVLFLYGVGLTAYGLVSPAFAPPPTSIWAAPFIAGPLLLVFPLLGVIVSYARRLP